MKLSSNPKRLVIFLFFDKDGIVDSYIPYMLSDIKKSVDEIFVVSNGKMQDESKKKLDGIADTIFCRKNEGFDVWGYKEALEEIGWKRLYEFDEVILMNYTIMGPVYPFKEMFDSMAQRDLDFWGITKFYQVDYDPFGTIECGFIHEHLQSHFIAVRKNMLKSKEFREYWEEMPMIYSYAESIGFHESKFTYYFDDLDYVWEPYIDTSDYEGKTYCPIIMYPKELLEKYRCPIFKRRSFMHDYMDILSNTSGEPGYELMHYLKYHSNYDTDMIWENLLRCYDMNTIKDNLHLNYILSEQNTSEKTHEELVSNKRIALVFHAYFPDLIESTARYIKSMPPQADVYITTDTEDKKLLIEERFKDNKFNKFEVILIENRGRDVSALLVAAKGFIMNYDYVCFAHDKKVTQLQIGSVGASFAYHCFENLLPTSGFVDNVIDTFNKNPRLGLLTPMPPIHADYFFTLGNGWSGNYSITKMLAKQLELNVPMDQSLTPVAPLGTMFWFRPEGMKKLFAKDWEYKDFPKEPNEVDGTLLHAIERIYGLVEQDAGFYSGWLFSDKCASMAITNLSFMTSKLSSSLHNLGINGNLNMVLCDINTRFAALSLLQNAGELFGMAYPQIFTPARYRIVTRLYIDNGAGFSEKASIVGSYKLVNSNFTCTFKIPSRYNKGIKRLRFDPGDDGFISLKNLDVKMIDKDKKLTKVNVKSAVTNGFKSKNMFVFLCDDPQIVWDVKDEINIFEVTVSAELTTGLSQSDFASFAGRHIGSSSLLFKNNSIKESFAIRILRKVYVFLFRRRQK